MSLLKIKLIVVLIKMELLNEKICHKAFKNGTIIDFTDSYITVKFDVIVGGEVIDSF